MQMVYSILALVLFISMFSSIMSALATLYSATGASTFIAWTTVIGIMPVLLLLGGSASAGFFYGKAYKNLAGSGGDPSGLLRLVLGILQIILFATLFGTVLTSFYTIYTTYCGAANSSVWIALGTVITILPTLLFLAGIFSGGLVAVSGARTGVRRRKSRRAMV